MDTHKKKFFIIFSILLLISIGISSPVLAQEETEGFTEDFDTANWEGWEHSQDVIIENGVLKIGKDNFIHRFGNWSEIQLDIRIQFTMPGEVAINYYVSEGKEYSLVLHDNMATLIKNVEQSIAPLAESPIQTFNSGDWNDIEIQTQGNTHTITINQEQVLTTTDPEPLTSGSFAIHVFAENGAQIDSISLTGTSGSEVFPAGVEQPEENPQPGDDEIGSESPPKDQPAEEDQLSAPLASTQTANIEQSPQSLLEEFFSGQSNQLELSTFLINLVLAVIAAFILGRAYIYWGSSLSNRRAFAANFILLTVTTTFIILVVRSSVALSLGLVGALSIVRFRAAVKEPEELAYLFFAISLGIGLGDNQRLITLLTLLVGLAVMGLLHLFRSTGADVNLHLTLASRAPNKIELEQITAILEKHCSKIKLLRYDETEEVLESSYVIEFKRVSDLSQAKSDLQTLSPSLEISFLDNKGIW